MTDLQQGIYWDHGQTPPRHFAIVFLRLVPPATAADADVVLQDLAAIWRGLQRGAVPGLENTSVPPEGLTWLLGFGAGAFAATGAGRALPRGLAGSNAVAPPLTGGGGPVVSGSGIRYAGDVPENPGAAEFAVQFVADTPLAAARAVVETWTHLDTLQRGLGKAAPLRIAAAFTGFNREDHRSWIGHHDGISNLRSGAERRQVIAVKPSGLDPADRWTEGGTYLAYMRLEVDLSLWNAIPRRDQDLLVGRDKITGCPLTDLSAGGDGLAAAGCPVAGAAGITDPLNAGFREPPDAVPKVLRDSHVQRANHHRKPIDRPASQRFFRQGYEFLEPPDGRRPLRAGLNFVSFQDTPTRVLETLRRNDWLGQVNFGGDPGPELIRARAAGLYFCPGTEADGAPYPGRTILVAEST